MDPLNPSHSQQNRPEVNLPPINTGSRSKSSSHSGSRSGSNSPRSFQGRQSYLSSVNGHRVSSPILISPGSTENFQPPSYSPRPPPLERQDTSLSLSYYYSSTGAGGPNSPVYTDRSISSSSLYSPELPSPAGSGFGGNSGGEDGSRFLSPRPLSSSVMLSTRSLSRNEIRKGHESPSRGGSLNASESLNSVPANPPTSSSPLNTSESDFAPPTNSKMYDSSTTSVRSSSTSSTKGTITKFFRQSRQASPVADEQPSSSPRAKSPKGTNLLFRDGPTNYQSPPRSPSGPSSNIPLTGNASPLGFEARRFLPSQQQQSPQAQAHLSFQPIADLNPSAPASRPLPVPNVLSSNSQGTSFQTEEAGSGEWAADIINELAMDSDSDNADDDRDHDERAVGSLTRRFGLQEEASEREHQRAAQEPLWDRRREVYRDHPPAQLINSWSTNLSSGPSGFLAEDESSPISPDSDRYRSATSSPQIPAIQLKELTLEPERGGASNLTQDDKPDGDETDITPRIRQVSQMDNPSKTTLSSREREIGLIRSEDDSRPLRAEQDGTNINKIEPELEVETEVEGYESESSFDDGTQPVRRQRQSTEYWDPISSSEADPWFNETEESFRLRTKTVTNNTGLPGPLEPATIASEDIVGNLGRATGLSAARERAARAKTAYLASLPNTVNTGGSTVRSVDRLMPTVQSPPSSNVESQQVIAPASSTTEPISHGLRDPAASIVEDNNCHDLSFSSSISSPPSIENPLSGMKRTFSRASGLSGSIGGPVSLDLQAEDEIEEGDEDRGRLDRSREVFMRSSRTPSPEVHSLGSSERQYRHSKQPSTATIRPLLSSPTLPSIPDLLSGATNLISASPDPKLVSEPSSTQFEDRRHSLSHARTLEELTAAVDRAINDTDDPPNFDLRTDFGILSSSHDLDPRTDENETARHLTRSASTTSEASTWGDHAPPPIIKTNQNDSIGQLDQESDYVLVESPNFPPPGEIFISGDLVNLQRRPSYKGPRTSAVRNVSVGLSLSVSSSTTLSELPSNTVRNPESIPKVRSEQPVSLSSSTKSPTLINANHTVTNYRQPLEPVHTNNSNNLRASQPGRGQSARSPNKPYTFGPIAPWPKAMMFSDVKSAKTSSERASMYARKINELSRTETGLKEWVMIVGGHRGQNRNLGLPQQQKPDDFLTDRKVSAASAVSEEAFPLRSSGPSFQVQQIRNVSPPSGGPPPNLPYPQLAQGIGMRSSPSTVSLKSISSRPSMSNSIANVAQGSGSFFQTLGRRGSTSAGSNVGGSGGGIKSVIGGRSKSPPEVLVEDMGRQHEGRNSVSPMKGFIGSSSKTGGQKLGGPRSRNLSRTPSISNPINHNYVPPVPPRRSVDLDHQTQNRHVLFPIPQRVSLSDISPPRSASLDYPIDMDFDKNLREMIGILKEEDQNMLAGYLRRANGSIPNAIGSFLEDQSRGII